MAEQGIVSLKEAVFTDPDATFIQMKEDHMPNGQLKPAYNLQILARLKHNHGFRRFLLKKCAKPRLK